MSEYEIYKTPKRARRVGNQSRPVAVHRLSADQTKTACGIDLTLNRLIGADGEVRFMDWTKRERVAGDPVNGCGRCYR